MSGFVVDSRTLVAVSDTLGRLHDQLVGMHTVIWHQWGTLGGQSLETELEHFCGTWHYGVSELGGQLQDLTRRLGEASAAYERIEQRITQASGGSSSAGAGGPSRPTGSGHTTAGAHHRTAGAHHAAAKHSDSGHHPAKHSDAKHHSAGGGKNYSGGAPIAPAGGGNHGGGDKHSKGGEKHPGVGSGTTVIGGGPDHGGGSHGAGHHRPSGGSGSGSGSGTTTIGGGPSRSGGSRGGSGTTTIDEKIRRAEERQQAELNAVLKMVKD